MERNPKMAKIITTIEQATSTTPCISYSPKNDDSTSRIILPLEWKGLEHQIECPVCTDFLIETIRMCTRGHSICQKCVVEMSHCPVCRKEMSQVRNYFLEFFMAKCTLKCKYYDQGCTAVLTSVDYYGHIERCHFREVCCRTVTYGSCETISNFKDYIAHLNQKHKIRDFVNGKDYCFHFPRGKGKVFQTPYASIKFDGKLFFYNFATMSMRPESGKPVQIALWWVSYYNPSVDYSQYRCKITICSWKDRNMVLSWSGPIIDFRVKAEKVFQENLCLICTLPGLKQYCSDDEINPSYLFSHVESAQIYKVEETEELNTGLNKEVTVLQSETFDVQQLFFSLPSFPTEH